MKVLEGKKTYLVALVLALLGLYLGVAVDPAIGVAVILTAAGMTAIGARVTRHQREILDAVGAIRQVIVQHQPLTQQQKADLVNDAIAVAAEVATSANGEPRG
jgi:hypothetical protein